MHRKANFKQTWPLARWLSKAVLHTVKRPIGIFCQELPRRGWIKCCCFFQSVNLPCLYLRVIIAHRVHTRKSCVRTCLCEQLVGPVVRPHASPPPPPIPHLPFTHNCPRDVSSVITALGIVLKRLCSAIEGSICRLQGQPVETAALRLARTAFGGGSFQIPIWLPSRRDTLSCEFSTVCFRLIELLLQTKRQCHRSPKCVPKSPRRRCIRNVRA